MRAPGEGFTAQGRVLWLTVGGFGVEGFRGFKIQGVGIAAF